MKKKNYPAGERKGIKAVGSKAAAVREANACWKHVETQDTETTTLAWVHPQRP